MDAVVVVVTEPPPPVPSPFVSSTMTTMMIIITTMMVPPMQSFIFMFSHLNMKKNHTYSGVVSNKYLHALSSSDIAASRQASSYKLLEVILLYL